MQGEITANGLIVGGMIGQRGAPGVGIREIEKTGTSGLIDTYTITYTNGTTFQYEVANGEKGDTGNGITKIEKTGTLGLVDTYTITYDNGTTTTYEVTNGEKGETGATPDFSIGSVTKGDDAEATITGTAEEPILNLVLPAGNGIASIEKTGTAGLVDTYTITFTDETTFTYNVTNGADGNVTDVQVEGQSVVDNGVANITGLATQEELDRYKTIYNVLPKVTGTGENLTLNNAGESILDLSLKGNTSQNTSILPDGYKQVDYIESSGTQYFATGYTPVQGDDFEFKNVTYDNGDNRTLFSAGEGDYQLIFLLYSTSSYFKYFATGTALATGDITLNKSNIKITNGSLYVDGELKGTSTYGGAVDTQLHIGNRVGGVSKFVGKYGEIIITNGTTTKRHYIPCYRTSDNEVGLYDLVTNTFLTNAGTGTFTKGNDTTIPNPDYPQPINVVSGDNEVKIYNANLFSPNAITSHALLNSDTGETEYHAISTVFTTEYIPVKEGVTYYGNYVGVVRRCFYDINKNFVSSIPTEVFTASANGYIRQSYNTSALDTIQIKEGNSATPFIEHKEQTYPINLPVENLFDKKGDVYFSGTGIDITYDSDNQEYTFNGTLLTAGNATLSKGDLGITENEEITISAFHTGGTATIPSGSGNAYAYSIFSQDNTKYIRGKTDYQEFLEKYTFTGNMIAKSGGDNDYVFLQLWIVGTTFDNYKIKIQIEKGSKSNSFTPYGTTPIELCKIGDYQDYFTKNSGKNLFDKDNVIKEENKILNDSGVEVSDVGGAYTKMYMPVKPNTTYTTSGMPKSGTDRVYYFDSNKTFIERTSGYTNLSSFSFTTPANCYFIDIQYYMGDNNFNTWQIEEGSSVSIYEPYGTGQWCKYNAIGKVVLDGSESWVKSTSFSGNYYCTRLVPNAIQEDTNCVCNLTNIFLTNEVQLPNNDNCILMGARYIDKNTINFKISSIATLESFKSFLSSNNVILYYRLDTPYLSLIEDETLIEQLDNIQNAMSYEGQTNVMQENNDKPFIIDGTALRSLLDYGSGE